MSWSLALALLLAALVATLFVLVPLATWLLGDRWYGRDARPDAVERFEADDGVAL